MIDQLTELRTKWAQAQASGTAHRAWRAVALSTVAPVRLFAALRDQDDRISILVETALRHVPKHRIRFHAEGISIVDDRSVEEGLLRLAVTLERPDLQDIFEVLVVDLISVAAAAQSADFAIQQTIRRLEAWQVCLRARRRGLEREEQAGLLGELTVLELLGKATGLARAIEAWSGPLGGIHDFQAAGVAVEVKTAIGISHHIRISRLDQLDAEGLAHLILARVRFYEAPEGVTLPEMISALRKKIDEGCPASAQEFSEKLLRTGYLDADAEFYASTRIVLADMHAFTVSMEFPRLIRAAVPNAIVEAAYSLDERQLTPFRMENDDFCAAARQMSVA
jgi:Putative  PD-(D/E)XK family member, (DUF4420)